MKTDNYDMASLYNNRSVILSECRKVWDWFIKFETKKPSVCNVYLDFLDGLTHTSYSVQVLDEWDFNESDRVHAHKLHLFTFSFCI